MRTLDRYLVTNVLVPFLYCFLGFVAIWLVIDLSDHGPDFIEAKVPLLNVAFFYLTQLPEIAVLCLPVGLLLAVLYGLGKMSRANELMSILTAGVSLPRILMPVFGLGFALALLCTFLNYQLAPSAAADKERMLKALTDPEAHKEGISGHVFRDRRENRTWYVERGLPSKNELRGVQVIQQDAEDRIRFKYYVRTATWQPGTKEWVFDRGMLVKFDTKGDVTSRAFIEENTTINGWDESPWRIASSVMKAELLTVPELGDYLKYNADFPAAQLAPFRTYFFYRFLLPWACFIVPFVAGPLAIVHSRRGVLASVASAIFIFFAMLFLDKLFLALGEGGRIPALVAALAPNLLFFLLGLLLLYLRATNKVWSDLFSFGAKAKA